MVGLRLGGGVVLCALAAWAQDTTPTTVYYSLSPGSLSVTANGEFDLSRVLPGAPACQVATDEYDSAGTCEVPPGQPYRFTLDSDRWNSVLARRVTPVRIYVTILGIPGKLKGDVAGWTGYDTGFEFLANGTAPVPPLHFEIGYNRDETLRPVKGALGLLGLVWMLAWWLRYRALSGNDGDDADRWFGYLSRKQYLVLGVWIAWCFLAGVTDMRGVLSAVTGRDGFLLDLVCYFAVPLIASLGITASSHAVVQKFRQAEWTLSETLQHALATELVGLLPLALLLISMEVWVQWGFLAAAACWIARSAITHLLASWSNSIQGLSVRVLSNGELFERVSAMAKMAGVKISSFLVLRSSRGRLRNAFAARGNRVMISDDLLETLNKREVDAVMAHELAHLKHGDPGIGAWLLPAAIVANVVWGYVASMGGEKWGWIVPLVPVGWLAVWAAFQFHSRRAERKADAAAAQLTNDPEAMISALGKLARMSLQPVEWGRWQESMMTHPSMQRRADSIATAAGKPAGWGELILHAPLAGGEHYPPQLPPDDELVFSRQARRAVVRRLTLWRSLASVFPVVLCAWVMLWQPWGKNGAVALGCAGIIAGWLMSQIVDGYSFVLAVEPNRRKLTERLGGAGTMFGYSPGAAMLIHEEGFVDYDFGFVSFENGLLGYRGDRTSFTLAAAEVESAQSVVGTLHHIDDPGVEVRWRDGEGQPRAFRLSPLEAGPRERREADHLAGRIEEWRKSSKEGPSKPPQEPVVGHRPAPFSLRGLVRGISMPAFFAGLMMAPVGFRNGMYAVLGAAVPTLFKSWKAWRRSRARQSVEGQVKRSRWMLASAAGVGLTLALGFVTYGLGKTFHARPGVFAPLVGMVIGYAMFRVVGTRPGISLRLLAAMGMLAAFRGGLKRRAPPPPLPQ